MIDENNTSKLYPTAAARQPALASQPSFCANRVCPHFLVVRRVNS